MHRDVSLSVLVPALNEEKHLQQTIDAIRQAVGTTVEDVEILIVDDGSTDATGVIARRMQAADPRIRLITNSTNLGLGGSYRRGLHEAGKTHFMYVPADNSWPAASLARILGSLGRADVITSYATNPEVRVGYRRVVSMLYTRLVNCAFGFKLRYYNGLTIYPLSFLWRHPPTTSGFGFQAELLLHALAARLSVVEVGVPIEEEAGRRSRAITLRNILSVLRTLAATFWALRVRAALRTAPAS